MIIHGADFNAENNHGETPLRKLLQHATRVSKDFHHNTRMKLARVLVAIGFRLTPHAKEISPTDETKSKNSPLFRPRNFSEMPPPSSSQLGKRQAWTLTTKPTKATEEQNHRTYNGSFRVADSLRRGYCKRPQGRDKVAEVFQSLMNERRWVSSLQHLCRLEVRRHLRRLRFHECVQRLELSPQMRQYLMFLPELVDETV